MAWKCPIGYSKWELLVVVEFDHLVVFEELEELEELEGLEVLGM